MTTEDLDQDMISTMKASFQTLSGGASVRASQGNVIACGSRGRSRHRYAVLVFMFVASIARAATNDLTGALQRGLFEEEANRNLDAAAQAYQTVSTQFDKDRALAATAIFRLGEIYRKQNRTNEAAAQYERIVREFSDQPTLTTLSRQNLTGLGGTKESPISVPLSRTARLEQKKLFVQELNLVEEDLAELKTKFQAGLVSQSEVRNREREVLKLRQQLAALDIDEERTAANAGAPEFNADAQLLTKLNALSIPERREVLPGISNDKVLSELIQQLNKADLEFASLANNLSENHPDYQRLVSRMKLLNEKIDAQVNGIMKAMEIRASATENSGRWGGPSDPTITAVLDEEETEIRRIQAMIQNSPDLINASSGDPTLTPLARAANKGQLRVAKFLLDNGADVQRNSPLLQAAGGGHKAMVELLLKHAAPVNATGGNNRTALHRAAERGFLSVTETLLSAKADPNAKDDTDRTPLTLAVESRFTPVAATLLALGADPNIICRSRPGGAHGRTTTGAPLHLAAAGGNEPMVALLLTNRADLKLRNPLQESPLDIATVLNHTNIALQLITAGADVNAAETNGAPPLFTASMNDHREVASLLLEHGANPNAAGSNPRPDTTSLIIAVLRQNAAMISLLLHHKADPNLADAAGYTALHYAAGRASDERGVQILQTLLSAGARPNAIDSAGASPLHWAARSGGKESLELLINAGAELNLRDRLGKTPLDLAKERQSSPRASAIASVGAQSSPPAERAPSDIAVTLRKHGALENLPMLDRIEVRRGDYSAVVFWKGTNDWNQFTLFELIGVEYGILATQRDAQRVGYSRFLSPWQVKNERGLANSLPFPDLAHVTIHRPAPNGISRKAVSIDVTAILNSGDCTKDVPLSWGDVIEIPEQDHPITEAWSGFSIEALNTFQNCLSRKLTISVKDQTLPLSLHPSIHVENGKLTGLVNNRPFTLMKVLEESKVLRSSSDLSRVKVTRRLPASGKQQTWVLDCSGNRFPDLWLRDGDVVEVPDKS